MARAIFLRYGSISSHNERVGTAIDPNISECDLSSRKLIHRESSGTKMIQISI